MKIAKTELKIDFILSIEFEVKILYIVWVTEPDFLAWFFNYRVEESLASFTKQSLESNQKIVTVTFCVFQRVQRCA